jgi:hypothetical protein
MERAAFALFCFLPGWSPHQFYEVNSDGEAEATARSPGSSRSILGKLRRTRDHIWRDTNARICHLDSTTPLPVPSTKTVMPQKGGKLERVLR